MMVEGTAACSRTSGDYFESVKVEVMWRSFVYAGASCVYMHSQPFQVAKRRYLFGLVADHNGAMHCSDADVQKFRLNSSLIST